MRKSKPTPVKNQKSISSFFTPKSTVNGVAKSQQSQLSQNPPPAAPSSEEPTASTNLYDAETDDEDEEPRVRSNRTTKRALAEDTNGGNSGIPEPPAKRAKSHDGEGSVIFASAGGQKHTSTASSKTKITPRTERFLYTSSGQVAASEAVPEEVGEDEAIEAQKAAEKARLHKKFVQKLGHPDSIAQIKRRNWQIAEETEALDGEGDGEEAEEETPPPTKSKKKGAKTGKLTPMEIQILDIKRKHMDTLLIVEVGYKFKFYGEDARTAAKELGIVCIPGKFRFDERKSIGFCLSSHSDTV
jgi:DNA mismatch repair protein MSH3